MELLERLLYLSNIALHFDYQAYLDNDNKQLIIFKIHPVEQVYSLYHGDNFDDVLGQANIRGFIDAKAGYLVDVSSQLNTTVNADLLLVTDLVLNSAKRDLDTILIHELVHCMIDSESQATENITQEANDFGIYLYERTDQYYELATRHTEEFCIILSQACINYNQQTNNFQNDKEAILSAMRFEPLRN